MAGRTSPEPVLPYIPIAWHSLLAFAKRMDCRKLNSTTRINSAPLIKQRLAHEMEYLEQSSPFFSFVHSLFTRITEASLIKHELDPTWVGYQKGGSQCIKRGCLLITTLFDYPKQFPHPHRSTKPAQSLVILSS